MNGGGTSLQRVRVWDLPTRVFHWLLATAVIALVVTAKVGGNAMVWHFRLGYLVLALLAFRLVWGLVGGRWSRFTHFIYGPGSVFAYLRGHAGPGGHFEVGHSPVGALSVFALLAVLSAQVGTGLVADDEIANQGPLYRFVSGDTAATATGWHTGPGQWLIIGLVVLHVLAIVFYRVAKGRNLVGPMLSGDKQLPAGTPASADRLAQRALALLVLALCAGGAAWVASLGG
ncbi:cytochrome b/b6 domain-containing protein [uncultured Aquincola sp.]|uniref:cytochrome b/b6 domain-containing protein n=1 Tax=uncultured Aquincola sp. TaxID=886556 RepID=UPI0032B17324